MICDLKFIIDQEKKRNTCKLLKINCEFNRQQQNEPRKASKNDHFFFKNRQVMKIRCKILIYVILSN